MLNSLKKWLTTQSSINGMVLVVAGGTLAYLQPSQGAVAATMIVAGLTSIGLPQADAAPIAKTAEDAIAAAAHGGAAGAVAALKADAPGDLVALAPLVTKSGV